MAKATMRLGGLYCILAELYCGDMEGNEWTELHYIAVEHKSGKNLIVYRESLDEDTRVFTDRETAEAYLELHDYFHSNCKRCWVERLDTVVQCKIQSLEDVIKLMKEEE